MNSLDSLWIEIGDNVGENCQGQLVDVGDDLSAGGGVFHLWLNIIIGCTHPHCIALLEFIR